MMLNRLKRLTGLTGLTGRKRLMIAQFITYATLLTFIGSIIYIVVRIILAPVVEPSPDISVRIKSDYIFMLIECVLGIVALLIPGVIRRIVRLNIPPFMLITYAVFLFCAIYLGEVRSFYYTIPHWDTVLHAFSGVALGALGFSLISLMNRCETAAFSLSPGFVGLFSFCFALSLGVIWEIYEFTIDSLLLTNSQKYQLVTGEPLVGQAALIDTMKDLIVDAVGALAMSIIGFVSLKHKKGWLGRLVIRGREPEDRTGRDRRTKTGRTTITGDNRG